MTEVPCSTAVYTLSPYLIPNRAFLPWMGQGIVKSMFAAAHFFATGSSVVAMVVLLV